MVPKKFSIFNHTYKVKLVKKVDPEDSWGEYDPDKKVIKVKKEQSTDQIEQTYLHEVVHCILEHLNYHKLNDDEQFVDLFSKALHQVLKTSEK